MCVFPTICIAQIIAKICKQRNVDWLGRFGLHTFDVRNDFSTGKHSAQISSNFLAEFAEISTLRCLQIFMWSVRYRLCRIHIPTSLSTHRWISKHFSIGKHLKEEHSLQLTNLRDQFTVLKKCRTKFDCLIYEMLFIGSIKTKLSTHHNNWIL